MAEVKDDRKQKRRYIQYKADKLLKEKLGLKAQARSNSWHRSSFQETLTRYLNFVHFFAFCLLSLLKTVAPWGLALVEGSCALLTYSLLVPCAVPIKCSAQKFHFSFNHSLEDVMLLSVLRALAVLVSYLCGTARNCHKPYLYTAIISTVVTVPFLLVKASIFDRPSYHPAAIILFLDFLTFSMLHIFVARKAMGWARNRYNLGLSATPHHWQNRQPVWRQSQASKLSAQYDDTDSLTDTDLPAHQLADKDSLFADCSGLRVHYKRAFPVEARHGEDVAILLVHGFGAGAFAWRHILQPLADAAGCKVLAFDRPAFGLSSRPAQTIGASSSPYSLGAQAELILRFCVACGLRRVVLAGHSDGALLSLMAAAAASRRSKGQSPHVVIDVHASTSTKEDVSTIQQPVVQQPCIGPLPLLLNSLPNTIQNPQHHPQHHRRPTAESFSSLSTSEDESGPSTGGSLAPLLQRASSRRHRRYTCFPASLYGSSDAPSETGLTADPEPVGVSNLTNQLQQQLLQQHRLQQPLQGTMASQPQQQPQHAEVSRQLPAGQQRESGLECGAEDVQVVGLALLHPTMAGEVGPSFTRLLGRSRLGRRILRPLLRSELGEVANRRTWFDVSKLTPEVLQLYKQPLKVQGWDLALLEMSRLKRNLSNGAVQQFCADCLGLPCLVLTGAKDRIVTPSRATAIAADMHADQLAVLPSCGHLSHEEAPNALLQVLRPFACMALA